MWCWLSGDTLPHTAQRSTKIDGLPIIGRSRALTVVTLATERPCYDPDSLAGCLFVCLFVINVQILEHHVLSPCSFIFESSCLTNVQLLFARASPDFFPATLRRSSVLRLFSPSSNSLREV